MPLHRRALVAALLSVALIAELPGSVVGAASARGTSRPTVAVVNALAVPPTRIAVKEPPRIKASVPAASAVRANVVQAVRGPSGIRVNGPPMLRPTDFERVLAAARRSSARSAAPAPSAAVASPVHNGRTVPVAPGTHVSRGGARSTLSLPSDPAASGTGINPWWRYQEENVPGGGHVMVNVGTGNMLLQDDDMTVPHKGIALAFRRTYNSQSPAVVSGYNANWQSLYGTGWTNTFDAHVLATSPTQLSVYDIDGGRYDYAANGNTYVSVTPGQHTQLTSDGGCGLFWTKKSGTIYYFWRPDIGPVCGAQYGAYAGRLYEIISRNRNTLLWFAYAWDNGVASAGGKISHISAVTEAGMTATLYFADVNGRRLLQQVVFPDGVTSVSYGYDSLGNLTTVSRPPNNAAGTRPLQIFAYQSLGSGSVLYWVASPRWCAATCGSDGGFTAVGYAGTDQTSSTVNAIARAAVINPVVPDGTGSGALQPGYSSAAFYYVSEYYTTGVTTPTFRDTDGHMTNWIVDGTGRPTQTQECTASTNQGQQCTGTWLVSNESWDASNNLVSTVDPRGFETDYAYDPMGNTIAEAQPQVTTSQGTFRPTSLFSYDTFNNVTAYCDPDATHALSLDWTSAPSGDALCPITNSLATRFIWSTDPTQSGTASANPSYEPYGQLQARIEPGTPAASGGYRVNYTYDASRQGGADYGLPTTVAAAVPISQADGTQRQPTQNFWYDINGGLGCYNKGSGTWVLAYDALGRLVSTADPDDSAAGSGICGKTGGMSGWNTASTTAYFADGNVSSKQSASQRAAGVSTTFTYDLDGNEKSETHHFGCLSVSSCTAGVTNKWYDGADRLVEVQQPYDANDIQAYPWSTRYIYDISGGHTTGYRGMGLVGYGNLVSTQELLSGTVWEPAWGQTYPISSGAWTDVRATSFDALDRAVSTYEAALGDQPKVTNTYDGPGATGLLSSARLATNEVKSFVYDGLGRRTDVTYTNDGGVTPAIHEAFDAAGHVTSRTTAVLGTETLSYDATGAPTSVVEPASIGGGTIQFGYYADGMRASTGYSDSIQTYPNAMRYGYRADGKRDQLMLGNGTAFSWVYTAAGRELTQSDPLTGTTISPDATYPNPKGVAVAFYPSSITYGLWTEAYDTYGRTQSITFPVNLFSYSSSQYDLDDGVSQHLVSGYQQSGWSRFTSQTVCVRSSIRGEKTCDPSQMGEINGAVLRASGPAARLPIARNFTLDARAGMLLHRTAQLSGTTDLIGSSYTYDASGRLVQDFEGANGPGVPTKPPTNPPQFTPPWCVAIQAANQCYANGTRTKMYDAENRLHGETFTYANQIIQSSNRASKYGSYWEDSSGYGQPANIQSVDYGTTNHPMRFSLYHPDLAGTANVAETRVWLWDGDTRLLKCEFVNGQCQNPSLSMEGLGDYDLAHATITVVNDRNRYGLASMTRDIGSFSGWIDMPAGFGLRTLYVPCSMGNVDADPLDPTPYCPPQHDGNLTADGWSLDFETWQGVRTSDLAVGQWNTPDAYAGDVHDPASQRPYMWNRNNPYAYSDPSGYEPQRGWYSTRSGLPEKVTFNDSFSDLMIDSIFMILSLGESGVMGGVSRIATRGGIGPVRAGQAGVAKSAARAEAIGETVLAREVTVRAANGVRVRPDLAVRDSQGKLKFIESKVGTGKLSTNQRSGYPSIAACGGVVCGKAAEAAGIAGKINSTPVQYDHW